MPKVVIAAGGTAGHVVPALAVADALRASGAEVEFVGGERAEAELVPAAGYPFHALTVAGIDRRNPLRAARALACARCGPPARARRLLRPHRRRRRAGRRRLRGRARSGWRRARCGCRWCSPRPTATSASPTGCSPRSPSACSWRFRSRAGTAEVRAGRPAGARPAPGPPTAPRHASASASAPRAQCLLVFGGSLGARRAERGRARGLRRRRRPARSSTRAGAATTPTWRRGSRRSDRPPHYHLHAYIEPFADALAAADLVVARAGGSVLEVAAAGLPSILVPYPHATADHQTANARYMERAGAAVVVPDARARRRRGWPARSGACCGRLSGCGRWPRRRGASRGPMRRSGLQRRSWRRPGARGRAGWSAALRPPSGRGRLPA